MKSVFFAIKNPIGVFLATGGYDFCPQWVWGKHTSMSTWKFDVYSHANFTIRKAASATRAARHGVHPPPDPFSSLTLPTRPSRPIFIPNPKYAAARLLRCLLIIYSHDVILSTAFCISFWTLLKRMCSIFFSVLFFFANNQGFAHLPDYVKVIIFH